MQVQSTAGLVFQYSLRPNGPWHTLVKNVPQSGNCGDDGAWFAWTATAPENYAYYRAYFGGTKYNSELLPSSSKTLLA